MLILSLILYQTISKDTETMFGLINDIRVNNNKKILALSDELCDVVNDYGIILDKNKVILHNLDGTVGDRLKRRGLRFQYAFEILAKVGDKVEPKQVFDRWMQVKKDIILGDFDEVGIAKVGSIWIVVFVRF